jgi:hypothetical protein
LGDFFTNSSGHPECRSNALTCLFITDRSCVSMNSTRAGKGRSSLRSSSRLSGCDSTTSCSLI